MSEQTFNDRLAALEEHIVAPEPTSAETFLEWAEEALAEGDQELALAWLRHAKIKQSTDELEGMLEEDDDAS